MGFFALPYGIALVGWVIHVLVDRKPNRRTGHRVVELALLWVLVFFGAWAILGALGHLTGQSGEVASSIGYAQSMFQWEVGWGDVTVGVLGIGCAWVALRDNWMTAAVVAVTISYGGDAIGHIMEYVAHDNTAPDNVWAIPSDIIEPLLAIGLLVAYRVGQRSISRQRAAAAS